MYVYLCMYRRMYLRVYVLYMPTRLNIHAYTHRQILTYPYTYMRTHVCIQICIHALYVCILYAIDICRPRSNRGCHASCQQVDRAVEGQAGMSAAYQLRKRGHVLR